VTQCSSYIFWKIKNWISCIVNALFPTPPAKNRMKQFWHPWLLVCSWNLVSCCTTIRTRRPASADRTACANFRLLANQWAERRLVTQWHHSCRAMRRSACNNSCFQCGSVPLRSDIKGTELRYPLPIHWYHSKGNWLRYNFAADFSSYIDEIVQKMTNLGNLSPFWGSQGQRRTLVDGSLESLCRVLVKCNYGRPM